MNEGESTKDSEKGKKLMKLLMKQANFHSQK